MTPFTYKKRNSFFITVLTIGMVSIFLIAAICRETCAAQPKQKGFNSPQEAVEVMINAVKAGDDKQLLSIFGPEAEELINSGDETQDRERRDRFVKAYDEKNRIDLIDGKKAMLSVGKDSWPMPIPIVKTGNKWIFETKTGKQEILARRIGRNELGAIQVCLAYVDAQREYAQRRNPGALKEYAQRLASSPGKKNGLCWDTPGGEPPSPMGPEIADACRETFQTKNQGNEPVPYHGYFYRILKGQGTNAPGGAYDYIVNERMVGGFALVAYPARYGVSGIMTFIVNHEGAVYQKDLGKNTEKAAEAMTLFDPDKTWKKIE